MRVVAFDLGRRRVGVAVSDASGVLARPWQTLQVRGAGAAETARLVELIHSLAVELAGEDDGLEAVVIGLPRKLDGSASSETTRAQHVMTGLRSRLAIPVIAQDERLTSREAESRLALREKDWRKRKLQLDAASAAIILQDYLDSPGRAR